jgi:sulfonate transport system permease protein
MAMTLETTAPAKTEGTTSAAPAGRWRRFARPALGLLLPVGLALIWEIVVWSGLSNGRLVPPPSKVFATIIELARSGELGRHVVATLTRVVNLRLLGTGAPAARSHRAGAARHSIDRLGAAVHPVARHF